MESFLVPTTDRFIIQPSRDEKIWQKYKEAVASFWTPEEIDLAQDKKDWETLSENDQNFLKRVLAFFAASDGIVTENLATRFFVEVQQSEIRAFYGFQIAMENIHSETYSLLLETFVPDKKEQNELFHASETIPTIKKKADWTTQWISSSTSFATRLLVFAIVEGVFFSGSFCAIFWMKKRAKLPGLCFSNELISRDEGLHCDFACLLYGRLEQKLEEKVVHDIMKEAVEIEQEFVLDSIPVRLIGMNAPLMAQYIEFVADRLLVALGYSPIWKVTNPFDWMTVISLQGKTNFFEKRVGEYQKSGVLGKRKNESFDTEVDF